MSRPRLLFDHDIHEPIISGLALRVPGVEFVRLREVLDRETPDPEVLARAAELGLIVVSHDKKTMAAAAYERVAAREPMPGLIISPQRLAVRTAINELHYIVAASEAEEYADKVEYLPL